jgi:hypothetical protein
VTLHEGMDEKPCNADGDEHGEEDKCEHEAPGRAWVRRRTGCLGWRGFLRIGHPSVYGDGYRRGRKEPKGRSRRRNTKTAATQIRAVGV